MQENQLGKTIWLPLTVIVALLLLSLLPPAHIGHLELRKIDILADLKPEQSLPLVDAVQDSVNADTTQLANPPAKLNARRELPAIEDYSEDGNALENFYLALPLTSRRPVRIAFFGDSFIEGDILTAGFRDTLQQLYGGRGIGYVPAAVEASLFRTTIRHTFKNWRIYSCVGEYNIYTPLATPGYCFIPEQNNLIEFTTGKKRQAQQFDRLKMFYTAGAPDTLQLTISDTLTRKVSLIVSDSLQQLVSDVSASNALALRFEPHDSLKLYGFSFESARGIYVDNFAMRGNSGMCLAQVNATLHRQFNAYQDYKLVILQYGLNAVNEEDSSRYHWYERQMITVINKLKTSFPKASILIIGVSDRSSNQNGTFATMPSIPVMRDTQRRIARKTQVAFWDLYEAMGGANSMVAFVEAEPPLGAKDYTHLTFAGGRKLAQLLARALLNAKKEFEEDAKI